MSTTTIPDAQIRDRVETHLLDTLARTQPQDDPFCHMHMSQPFPDDLYDEMLRRLPASEHYRPINLRKWSLADGTSTRDCLELFGGGLERLPEGLREFWEAISLGLGSRRVQLAIFEKLITGMRKRFGSKPIEEIEAYPKLALMRDIGGYEIKPHPDAASKIVTVQFYLPANESQRDMGTSFYKMRLSIKGLTSVWGRFATVKEIPFVPNSGYGFVVTRSSWHGREMLPLTSEPRNPLMLLYYNDPSRAYT